MDHAAYRTCRFLPSPINLTWWVPLVFVGGGEGALGQGSERVLDDAREAGLHEGVDRQVVHPVLVDELHRHLCVRGYVCAWR